ncbi:hypothetical protein HPP92_018056 [Vanilla planifolia]|uniref:HNH nuclease domain-containing protein n=1 Tax=Vanilla planifolia TaxID=51239 RepID=A0A835UP57_VANPL|nr:hypothetical protein HPP92_018056 [Vanilla planifolia]
MARLTADRSLRLFLHGERASFGGEPKDPIHLRLGRGRRYLNNLFGFHGKSKSIGPHQGLDRVSVLGKKGVSLQGDSNGDSQDCCDDDDEEEEEDELSGDELSCFRGLVLDVSYRPVNVVCWKRAICLEFLEKADVLEYYDQTVSSPVGSFNIPAVLRVTNLLQVGKRRRIKHNFSRKSIYYRDSYTCQYCSSRQDLTIDHVVPTARGGEWKWENLVTACANCNSRKGQKTLEEANMTLIKIPKAPKDYDILTVPLTSTAMRMMKRKKGVPNEWRQYLPN